MLIEYNNNKNNNTSQPKHNKWPVSFNVIRPKALYATKRLTVNRKALIKKNRIQQNKWTSGTKHLSLGQKYYKYRNRHNHELYTCANGKKHTFRKTRKTIGRQEYHILVWSYDTNYPREVDQEDICLLFIHEN